MQAAEARDVRGRKGGGDGEESSCRWEVAQVEKRINGLIAEAISS